MLASPFTLIEPVSAILPLVVDSPHSGRNYPEDFHYACPLPLLRQAEDFMVDALVEGCVRHGATLLKAEFPRSYIDVNRAEDDIDPAVLAEPWPSPLAPCDRTLLGLGLVRRMCKSGVPVHAAPLSIAEVQKRIENYYRPYHAVIERLVGKHMAVFGECVLINAHSMPGFLGDNSRKARPDIILGDRLGTSCDPSLTRKVSTILRELGFSVALNDPYKGMEIVRRYGQPEKGRQALQLEINRRLYMNEETLVLHEGFTRLQNALSEFFRLLAMELRQGQPHQLAAE
jgi:N-formylglutamate amidohydrolase